MNSDKTAGDKRKAIAETKCIDTLLSIGKRIFLGVPSKRCYIKKDEVVQLMDGPLSSQPDSNDEKVRVNIIQVSHTHADGEEHIGWAPAANFVKFIKLGWFHELLSFFESDLVLVLSII